MFWILHQILFTLIGHTKMNEFNLTHDEIRQSTTTKLRNILKEDIPVELDDMINYERFIREFS